MVASGGVVDADGRIWYPSEGALKGAILSKDNFNVPRGELTDSDWDYMRDWLRPVLLSLSFLVGRHVSPLPSNTPWPVIAIFSALRAEIGDWQRRVSKPSKEVFIMGYSEWSALNNTNAFFSVYRFRCQARRYYFKHKGY